ncbi:hypothetical protein FQZ97_1083570 [compost metagenome]
MQLHAQGLVADFTGHVVAAQQLVEGLAQRHVLEEHVGQRALLHHRRLHDEVDLGRVGEGGEDLADVAVGHGHADGLAFQRVVGGGRGLQRFGRRGAAHLPQDLFLLGQQLRRLGPRHLLHAFQRVHVGVAQVLGALGRRRHAGAQQGCRNNRGGGGHSGLEHGDLEVVHGGL